MKNKEITLTIRGVVATDKAAVTCLCGNVHIVTTIKNKKDGTSFRFASAACCKMLFIRDFFRPVTSE